MNKVRYVRCVPLMRQPCLAFFAAMLTDTLSSVRLIPIDNPDFLKCCYFAFKLLEQLKIELDVKTVYKTHMVGDIK